MDPNELLKLLDLSAKPARPPDGAVPQGVADATASEPTVPRSPTALQIDEWGLRRGRDLVAESERLRKVGTDEFAAANDPHVLARRDLHHRSMNRSDITADKPQIGPRDRRQLARREDPGRLFVRPGFVR